MTKIGFNKELIDFNDLKDQSGMSFISSGRFTHSILENPDQIKFEYYGLTGDYKNWSRGRLFGPESELKWQIRNGKIHLVVISDEDFLPAGVKEYTSMAVKKVKDRSIFLWGEKDRTIDGWYEAKIPQILAYPVNILDPHKRVRINVTQYEIEETGKLNGEIITCTFYRFSGLNQI